MSKRFIKEIEPNVNLFINDRTGIAWIENGKTGMNHSIHPNISSSGSIKGMKQNGYWDKKDLTVNCNGFIYNISKIVTSDEYDKIVLNYCSCEKCIERRKNENNKE